jgi:hypothetical protein
MAPLLLLISALDGGQCSASRPGRFTPQGKSPWYPLDRNLGGPQGFLDAVVVVVVMVMMTMMMMMMMMMTTTTTTTTTTTLLCYV